VKVKDLRAALLALPPEMDESVIVVSPGGMSNPEEATRLIQIPRLYGSGRCHSYQYYPNVLWLDVGGALVSTQAEKEGWKVVFLHAEPSKAVDNLEAVEGLWSENES
jgi:hypothetical protein